MEQLKSLLTNFVDVSNASIQELQNVKSFSNYPIVLAKNAKLLAKKLLHIGTFATENMQVTVEAERLMYAKISFDWIAEAKDLLLLWRDSLLEAQKAELLLAEKQVNEEQIFQFKASSNDSIQQANNALLETLEAIQEGDYTATVLAKYEVQNTPYPIYEAQIETIITQCSELLQQSQQLHETHEIFGRIQKGIRKTANSYRTELKQLKAKAKENIEFVEANQAGQEGKISPFIRTQEEALNNSLESEYFELNNVIASLTESQKIFTSTNGGTLLYQDISFQKNVQLWLETELLPKLHKLHDLKQSIRQNLKMTLLNLSNRIVILKTQNQEESLADADLSQPLHDFLQRMSEWENQFKTQQNALQQQLEEELRLSKLYDETANFLSVPLQATLNQLRHHPTRWFDKLQQWWNRQRGVVEDFQRTNKRAEALSTSERVVRIIQNRSNKLSTAYSNIFLTQGYIGETFCVGREDEMQHIEDLIIHWKQGFRGSVLLSGQRFAGKTLFGEQLTNRYFPKECIRLSPNMALEVAGRRMTSDYDLGKSLDFIRKYSVQKQSLIWIDDLELWHNQQAQIGDNINVLFTYLEKYYHSFFFVVSVGNALKKRLHDFCDLESRFQAEINLDAMSWQEIQTAILTRHSATHRQLILADGKELSPKAFAKISQQIYRKTEGNIGDALTLWAASTKEAENNTVIYRLKEQYALPNFLDADNAILLRALIFEKRSNEYRLRKLFGEIFKDQYSPILQRLLGVGILTRQIDGWLELNATIANDVGRALEAQQFLNFRYNK